MSVLTVACGPGFPQLTCCTPAGVLNVPIRVLVPDSLACIINPAKSLPPCRVTAGKNDPVHSTQFSTCIVDIIHAQHPRTQ